ncbi:MAG: hypothetical protein R2854_10575 [Caldilineaceae bacterium]
MDRENGQLAFQNVENFGARRRVQRRYHDLSAESYRRDQGKFGYDSTLPPSPPFPVCGRPVAPDDNWRVTLNPSLMPTRRSPAGSRVAQSLEPMARLLAAAMQLLWGIPLALALAGAGGYFLASRALAPIERITRTGQAITAKAISRRIDATSGRG